MKNKLLLSLIVSLFAVSAWAADVSYTEKFSKIGNLNNNTSDVYGDLCTWHRTLASHRAQDTILVKTRRAFLLPVAYSGKGKLETTDWEGGIKSVEFKFGRFGSENTAGRVLQLNVKAGTIENPTATYAKNAMKLSTGTTPQGNETYSYEFNCKEQDAQLVIENISTHNETLSSTSSICRILVADIVVTPYILYTQKEATIGLKQQGYVNQEFLDNSGGEALTYSSSNTSIATVDPATGVVTPVSAGDVQIYAALADGARTFYTLHVVDGIVAENFSKVVQTGSASNDTWHGDLFDWTANAARRGVNDTIKGRPIDRQQATWFSKEGYVESSAVVEGGVKNISFLWRQWSAKAESTTTKVAVSYGGEVKAYQEFEELAANDNKSFNEDIDGGNANAVLRISNLSYNGTGTVNNRIVIENVKITPWLLYTTKEATLDTRVSLNYTNNDLINNTTGDAPTYEIAPANAAVSINGEGQVAVEDGADVNNDFIVTATWGAVTTTYTLHILSRSTANVSFAEAAVRIGLDGSVDNALNKDSHDGTAVYSSDNDAVATVNPATGAVTLQGGVGQVKISVSLPQTANYKAASASYNLYVRDNGARKEAFKGLSQSGVVGADLKDLVDATEFLFDWQAQYQVRRGAYDTIWNTTTKGVSIGISTSPSAPSILQSKNPVEGGIKHLSFYWKQWAKNSDKTLRMSAYAGSTLMAADEHASNSSETYSDYEKFLFGASAKMKSNQQLIIKNESYTGSDFEHGTLAADAARIIIDTIYITPYLLYTTKERTLDMQTESSCTYTPEINNIGGVGSITYSLENNDEEATINPATGEVTGIKAGEVTVKATWSEGAFTTYTLTILAKSVAEASYPNAIVRIGLDEAVDNTLAYTTGYDGTIAYASSNTAVADFEAGALVIKGVGQTTITATLPETENYLAAEASYNLYVRDEQARVEAFTGITGGVPSDADVHDWGGDLFMWQRQYQVRRSGNDTIHAGTDKHQATSIGVSTDPAAPSILQSKEPVEGGIKYLSFYWAQWGAANECTRRITVYAGDEKIGEQENPNGAEGRTGDEFLLGINNAMKSNKQLIIKNESYKGTVETLADNASRIVLDNIYITPWLLYTDKAERVLRVGQTDKNTTLINNTGADASFESSNPAVASVAYDGTVTAVGRGKATITAKYSWSEEEVVTTTYPVTVWPVNCETFDGIEQTGNYSNTTPREGDKATWTTSLGGFNVGNCGALTTNLVRFRAPNNAGENAFIESSAITGGIGAMTFDWNLGGNESTTEWDIRVFINGQLVKTLTNAEISATGAMNHFEQIAIEGINEPGNFVIRFENHSTIGGTYPEDNKARFLMDNITWTSYEGTKTLAEDTNNEGWIRANGGQTVDVAISRSPLVANVWNTLCLPFAISKSTDLDGAEVKEMTGVAMVDDVLEIYFSDITGDELVAGKPYLVKPSAEKNISGTYENKQIALLASPVVQDNVTMQGLYSPMNVTKDDYNTLFVGTPDGEGNNLFYPQADGTLRGLRAYFKIGGAPLPAPHRARYVVTQKDVVTGIESVQNSDVRIQKIIRDGQLFIIRDGKMYNVQGIQIR